MSQDQTETKIDQTNGGGFSPDFKLRDLETTYRAHTNKAPLFKLAILSNYSTQFMRKAIELSLSQKTCPAEIYEAEYNQWEFELIDPASGLSNFNADFCLISLSTLMLAYNPIAKKPIDFVSHFKSLLMAAKERNKGKFIVSLPEPTEEEHDQTTWAYSWRKELIRVMHAELASECYLLDLEPLISEIGLKEWKSSRFLVTSKLPCHPDHSARLGNYFADFIAALRKRPVRLVIVDLDDTLWHGIVGEVGYENVELNYEEKGLPHLRLQRLLLDLNQKGVMLAICSKNTEDIALKVFSDRPEMILKANNFADIKINWDPKSDNVRSILKELNLTEPGTVFLDDSSFERENVRQIFPEIYVPELHSDPNNWIEQLLSSGHFVVPSVTQEDLNRQKSYAAESLRNKEKDKFSDFNSFLKSLQLTVKVTAFGANNIERVEELINKTNQFNLTARRHNFSQLEELNQAGNYAFAFSLKDRLNEYGIIGVLIATKENKVFTIDSWLMSCRAMGRTVENAMLAHLIQFVVGAGAEQILGEFVPTAKNAPVKDLYSKMGFDELKKEGGSHFYKLSLDKKLPTDFVEIGNSVIVMKNTTSP
jgi:FkbH-like protein